jgi:hypothetical protein
MKTGKLLETSLRFLSGLKNHTTAKFRNKKSICLSDIWKKLVAGTGFEPMTFGL